MDLGKKILLAPALLLSIWSVTAHAQCAGGGGPQYQQCMNDFMHHVVIPQQQAAAAQAQTPQPPPDFMAMMRAQAAKQAKKGWGAVAMTPDLATLGASIDHRSRASAESAALRDCASKGGRECALAGAAQNQCVAVAANADRLYAMGSAEDMIEASRNALAACNERSPDKICNLRGAPVCPGIAGGPYDIEQMTDEQVARAFETVADPRLFWGAVASNGKSVYASAQALSQAAAERMVKDKCGSANCKLITTHRNSCVVVAWNGSSEPFVSQRMAPEEARIDALSRCSAAHGSACKVSTPSCSGRLYFDYDYARLHNGAPYADNNRSRQAGSVLLEPWMGHPVAEFRSSWGYPSDTLEVAQGEERLTYAKDFTTTAGAKRSCTVSIFTRAERVFSYLTEGDGCKDILR